MKGSSLSLQNGVIIFPSVEPAVVATVICSSTAHIPGRSQCLPLAQSSEATAGVRRGHQADGTQDTGAADSSKVCSNPKSFGTGRHTLHPRLPGPCR